MKEGLTFYLKQEKRDLLVHIVVGIYLVTGIIHLALASTQPDSQTQCNTHIQPLADFTREPLTSFSK